MESYPPEWSAKMEDIADTIRRAREVRLIAIECRHRAAVLRVEAEGLRTAFEGLRPAGR